MGTPHGTSPSTSGSAAPLSTDTSPTKPLSPCRGASTKLLAPNGGTDKAALPPTGVTTQLLTPGGGMRARLNPRRGQQHPLAPTCQWVKGDSTYDIDNR